MKNKKLIYGLLLASLAINFFFAGIFFTHLIRGPERPFGPPDRFKLEAARQALSPQYREVVGNIAEENRQETRERFRRMFELRRKMRQILLAEEFDEAAFDAVVAEMGTVGENAAGNIFFVLRQIAKQLPASERRKYFEVLFSRDNPRKPPGGKPEPRGR